MTGRDRLIAGLIFVGVTATTLIAAPSQGIHRDEAYYMDAGEQYATYWEKTLTGRLDHPFSDAAIARFWELNHEHPPLMKLLYGLSWRLFHRCDCATDARWHPGIARLSGGRHVTLPLLSEVTAFRLPTMLSFGLLCALVYLFFVEAFGSTTGALAAALLMAAQPRAFFHAQTAAFDLPAATLWFATTYAYWRSLAGRSSIWVGVLYGLFLATKLQSFFLPLALGAHWLWLAASRLRRGQPLPTIRPFVAMVTIGPLLFVGLWPWLWHDTVRRIGAYLQFHWQHVHYNFEYLGRNYNHPPYPWHEPLGMLVTTAPIVLLALAVVGAGALASQSWARRQRHHAATRSTSALLLVGALVPVAPFFLGTAPIFGETKHWLATMPFLALCAGVALHALADRLTFELRLTARPFLDRIARTALLAIAFTPAAVETARSHPYGLSHYNALAGGAPGGADLGMNRQFWGYSVGGVLPWLNAHLPVRARLYLHDWNHDAFELYQREGALRPDITDAGMEEPGVKASDAALVIHEKHFAKYEYMIWKAYGHVRPSEVLTLDGVPLVTVYTRR